MRIIKNNKVKIISLCLGLVLLLTFFITKNMSTEVFNNNISLSDVNTSTSGSASASYIYYENYDEADKRADTIVIGDVIKVNEPEELVTGETTNTITWEKEPVSHVFTVSEIKVGKVIKGKYSPGDIIKVKQYGGSYKGVEYSISGEKYYKTGERHIFFLESYEDSPSMTINPYQGDMLIENGKIKATNKAQFINDNVSEDLAEKKLKDKIENLKNINNYK